MKKKEENSLFCYQLQIKEINLQIIISIMKCLFRNYKEYLFYFSSSLFVTINLIN